MKHALSLATIVAFAFLFYASATQKAAIGPSKQTFTFGYKASTTAKPGSATMLVALIRPYYGTNFSFGYYELFDHYRKFMGDDIQQLLIDKGFNIINKTYQNFDELTYDDKKSVQLAFDINITPEFTAAEGGWTAYRQLSLYGPSTYSYGYKGTVSLTCHLTINGIEPLTNQKVFTKSLNTAVVEYIQIQTGHNLPTNQMTAEFLNDPNVYNALGAALQKSYANIMRYVDTYIDPKELASYQDQIKELKGKKVF